MMSILGFREQTLDPIITAHTAGEGGKKGKKGKELGVPSQHQATCCAAGFCRVLGPNVVVQASQLFWSHQWHMGCEPND